MPADISKRLARRLLARGAHIVIIALLGALATALLVRYSPGFGVDERELDSHLSSQSIQAVRAEYSNQQNVLAFFSNFVRQLTRGDLGISNSLHQPISEILRDRVPVTLKEMAMALLVAWLGAIALSFGATALRSAYADAALSVLAVVLFSSPAAVTALLLVIIGGPVTLALALILLPTIFRYTRNILNSACRHECIMAARSRGIPLHRILFLHVLPLSISQIVALAGVSVSMAFGASIPVEVVSDVAGAGQLAWQAAVARDLPLLVTLTAAVTLVTLLANTTSDLVIEVLSPGAK